MKLSIIIKRILLGLLGLIFMISDISDVHANDGYVYTSERYGYTIKCAVKPVGVIEASDLYESDEGIVGEVLIFDNEEYNIKKAWIVIKDAFSDEAIPNLNQLSEEETASLLNNIKMNNHYEKTDLILQSENNKGIYAVTAKEVEVDEDGDGVIDGIATTDNQIAVMVFRGEYGGRFALQLIDNPELRQNTIEEFINGVRSFRELKR